MNVYLDSSVVLRVLLKDPARIRAWEPHDAKVTSALLEVECLRTFDALRARGVWGAPEIEEGRDVLSGILHATEVIEVSPQILRRASETLTVPLRTLDAIHLASALAWLDDRGGELTMATHDVELAAASRSKALKVIGV